MRPNPEHTKELDDDEIGRRLVEAGARPEPPADDLARIREAARAEWLRLPRRGRRSAPARRRLVPLALAAGLVGAVAVAWLWTRRAPPPSLGPPVATVERLSGEVRFFPGIAAVGAELRAGSWVETANEGPPARIALRFASGSVRLDSGTQVRFLSPTRLYLGRGAVYVDSQSAAAGGGLEVDTELGLVREVGTQFEVRVENRGEGTLEVRVREGRIEIDGAGASLPVAAGEKLRLSGDGAAARTPLAPWAPEWEWVLAAAPLPAIEGRSLRSFLDWSCRESGLRLRFDRPETERSVAGIVLHGTVEGLRPEEALAAVLAGAGFEHRVEGGELVIRTPG